MDAEFWLEKWRENRIGFNQSETNKLLMKHWPKLSEDAQTQTEVFVPLCGKSCDMLWLSNGGFGFEGGHSHRVIGVEVSRVAIEQFYEEQGVQPGGGAGQNDVVLKRQNDFDVYRWGRWELWCGDFFAFPKERLTNTKLAYDRASLIALPADIRQRYADKMHELLPKDAAMLLLTLSYDPGEMDGPPYNVTDQEVHALYGNRRRVEHLETRDALAASPGLRKRGLSALSTSAFIIGESI